jgi:hypothetical protein
MKNIILAGVILFSLPASAQRKSHSTSDQHLYFNLSAGYGLPACSEVLNENANYDSNGSHFDVKRSSLGAGVTGTFFCGYMFNQNFGVECGISYLQGTPVVATTNSTIPGGEYNYKEEYTATTLRGLAGLRMTFGDGNFRPYMRMAMLSAFGTQMKYSYSGVDTQDLPSDVKEEYKGGISLGFAGGLGATYELSNGLSLFSEIALVYHNWAPAKSEYTKAIDKGSDYFSTMTVSESHTVYVNSISYSPNSVHPSNEPGEELKYTLPMSSIGLNIGIQYAFGE